MKRFLAFRNSVYYAAGGMNDFLGDFDTLEEAQKAVRGGNDKWENDWWNEKEDNDWGHIYDSLERTLIGVDNHPTSGHY